MKSLWLKLSVIIVVIVFLDVMFVSFASIDSSNSNSFPKSSVVETGIATYQPANSDPSVHLYVNGNGYVVFSANYSVDGFINCQFDNDKTQNFTTNDVPAGTVFHLVSSPKSGYALQQWKGTLNSTDNSINITANKNINEEAIYQKEAMFSVTFTECGLPAGDSWWVNFNGQNITSSTSTITFDTSDGTYSYTVQSMGTYGVNYNPTQASGTVTVDGFNQTEYVYYYPEYYLHVTASPSSYGSITLSSGWYDSGESLDLLATPNSGYAFSSWKGTGSGSYTGTSDSASITMNGPINETAIFYIPHYSVTFTECGLPAGTPWYVNLTENNGTVYSSGLITSSSYTFNLTEGAYSYITSSINTYYVTNGTFTVVSIPQSISVNYLKYAYLSLSVAPSSASVSINGHNVTLVNGRFLEYLTQGYYYITVTNSGYKPYTNLVYLSWNGTYSYSIPLTHVTVYGYLTGIVLPENATVTANGVGIPVMNGYFNVSLAPGTYYITVTSPGYIGNISVETITQGKATPLTVALVKLAPTIKTVTVSGYISQANASVTVNGISAYVNSTGYYSISVPSGNVIISAYESGYYPYSRTVDLTTSQTINIALVKEPIATSIQSVSGTVSSGYNVTVTNLVTKNGYISMDYNATVNGTITVLLPYSEIRNATISDILSSKVYIDGTSYTDFAIAITSSGSAVLSVYNLSGDPVLYWKYSPAAAVPQYYNVTFTESGLNSGTIWSVTFNGVNESSKASTIVFTDISNGTYSYKVSSVANHTSSPSSGSITVRGKNTTQSLTFTHNPSKNAPFKLSSIELYAIIGAVVAIAAIGGAFMVIRRRK